MLLDRTERYSTVAIWFHWTIALLVVLNLAVGLLSDPIPALRPWMAAHKSIGITVLVLTFGRIAWRLAHRAPPLPAGTQAWEKGVAHATHWTLYLLLVAMPLTGWLMVSGTDKRRPLDWFGLFDIPYLPVSKAAGGFGHEAHGVLGWLMLALVVLHVAAALRHHLILRDTVLARMAPMVRR
ncbi:cytochrome b [Sphingomonas sp. PB2P19]|uniref:cytochrome b n=1 Tax=Sphingomonas rhamnosi TaxID=3096156 RepID=UPI002FC58477